MNARPWSVTLIAWLFIAAGLVGLSYHAREFNVQAPFERDLILALVVRLLAIVGGAFALRGANWARWLLIVWLAYHVVLSAGHSVGEAAMHAALLAVVAYVLFRPAASAYFRRSTT